VSAPERGPAGTWQHLAWWADGGMALGTTQANLVTNDRNAAMMIAAERMGGLHYAVTTKTWHAWTGQAHPPDASNNIDRIIMDFGIRLGQMLAEARGAVLSEVHKHVAPDAKQAVITDQFNKAWTPWKKAEDYAAGLARQAGKVALRGYLETVCGVEDDYMAERNPGLLNFPNGTLDLASLELRPHRREDMITYVLSDPWNPYATCPRFWELVWQVSGRDPDVAAYLVKVLGYCLLGDNREQKIIFISGPSGSGKSVLLHLISEVMGPVAHRSGAELITVVQTGRNARKENSIRGKRLVTITETSKFMNIDEGQLKRITGEPVISTDRHYATTELKTPVSWTIVVATNDMPNLLNFDAAMRRRVIVIPGGRGLREDEMDPQLAAKILSTERQGIMALLARGCAEYFRSGLRMPLAVSMATDEYAAEQNTVANFVADTMVLGGWTGTGGIHQHDVWTAYEQWSKGTSRLGKITFFDHMKMQPNIGYSQVSRRFENVAWNQDWQARV
jgi:P4 family phage/plasmid primase-like protien